MFWLCFRWDYDYGVIWVCNVLLIAFCDCVVGLFGLGLPVTINCSEVCCIVLYYLLWVLRSVFNGLLLDYC